MLNETRLYVVQFGENVRNLFILHKFYIVVILSWNN